ncbi:hypothetical protein BH09ACT6_BH09ACT6_15670 [soil metagenome]
MLKILTVSALAGAMLLGGAAPAALADSASIDVQPVVSADDQQAPYVAEIIDPSDPVISSTNPSLLGTPDCGSTAYAPPGGSYGPESRARCALSGSKGFRTGYTWNVQSGSSTRVCAFGLGFNSAYSPVYYGLGCGSSGAQNVNWGNVLAYQKLKAYSYTITGGNIDWH